MGLAGKDTSWRLSLTSCGLGFGVGLESPDWRGELEVRVTRREEAPDALLDRDQWGSICSYFRDKESMLLRSLSHSYSKTGPCASWQDDCSKGGIQSGLRTRARPRLLPSTSPLSFPA